MNDRRPQFDDGDEAPVGGKLPDALRSRVPMPEVAGLDDLGVHLARLLTLHPDLQVAFRASDIQAMTQKDREYLLQDINEALGIPE